MSMTQQAVVAFKVAGLGAAQLQLLRARGDLAEGADWVRREGFGHGIEYTDTGVKKLEEMSGRKFVIEVVDVPTPVVGRGDSELLVQHVAASRMEFRGFIVGRERELGLVAVHSRRRLNVPLRGRFRMRGVRQDGDGRWWYEGRTG